MPDRTGAVLEHLDGEDGHAYGWGGGGLLFIILLVVLLVLIL